MIQMWTVHEETPTRRTPPMHELLIAIAFIGMIIAPAIVAANPESARQSK
jgi:hypothetical protein